MGVEIVGTVACPHCGNTATVHRQRKGKAKLYYRCYTERGGAVAVCGTVQITGPKGQEWLQQNTRFTDQPEPIGAKPATAAPIDPPKPPAEQPKRAAVGGFLANFWKDDDE